MVYTLVCHLYCKDDPECIKKVKLKLIEASRVYKQDREQVDWIVMQDVHDPRKFTIVERFEQESSQKYHLGNPYWKGFDPYVIPLLEKPIELARHEELDITREVDLEADQDKVNLDASSTWKAEGAEGGSGGGFDEKREEAIQTLKGRDS